MIVASLVLCSALVVADEALSLQWEAPPECPDGGAVVRRLTGEHGNTALEPHEFRAVVTREPDGYRLRGELRSSGNGQAVTLSHAGNCSALIDKLVLRLKPLYMPLPFHERPPDERPLIGRYLRIAAALDRGTLRLCGGGECDDVAGIAGASLSGGWRRGRLRVELGAPLYTLRTVAPKTDAFEKLAIRWYVTGAQFRLCGALERRSLELLACGELGLWLLIGQPGDPPGFRRAVPLVPWGVAGVGLAAVYWLHARVGVRIEATPGVHLRPGAGYRVFDEAAGADGPRRSHVEIGLVHLAFGIGLDLRLGVTTRRGSS